MLTPFYIDGDRKMIDKLAHITVKENGVEVEYPIAFDFNVLEEIQDKYGSFNEWQDKLDPADGSEIKFKDLKFIFLTMINEGIDIENEEKCEDRKFITDRKVGRILTEVGMERIAGNLKEVITNSLDGNEKN